MTNSILKRLATKGFLSMRKVNARNIHYLVTPEGIDLIARRSYRYLRRTVGQWCSWGRGGRGKLPPRSVPAAARRGPGPADPAPLPLRRAGPRGLRYPLAQAE